MSSKRDKSILENGGKKALESVSNLITNLASYESGWGMLYVILALAHVVFYQIIINILWTSETLAGYGVSIYLSPVSYVYLGILLWSTTIPFQSKMDKRFFRPISNSVFVLVSVLAALCLLPEVLYIIKFSLDANNCAAVRGNTYNWGASTNNGTLTGIGGDSLSPIVCKNPYYGQWVAINCFAVVMLLGTLGFLLVSFFYVWNMLKIGEQIHRLNGGYDRIVD